MSLTAFRQQLAETQAAVDSYLLRVPNWHLAPQVVPQLAALEQWTGAGRWPSRSQCDRINLGLLAVREIEPTDDLELYRIAQGFHELNYALTQASKGWMDQLFAKLFSSSH
jgi:hypothetical protein